MILFTLKAIAGGKYHKESKDKWQTQKKKICVKRANDKTLGQNVINWWIWVKKYSDVLGTIIITFCKLQSIFRIQLKHLREIKISGYENVEFVHNNCTYGVNPHENPIDVCSDEFQRKSIHF